MNTTVVNKRYTDKFDVYIGRGSKWGNPYSHLPDTKAKHQVATKEEAIDAYYEWIFTQPELLASLHELKGKTLGCFCKPNICHGVILAELAEMTRFYFTFGMGQPNEGKCLIVFADSYEEARSKMFEAHGKQWAFQYTEEEFIEGRAAGLITEQLI